MHVRFLAGVFVLNGSFALLFTFIYTNSIFHDTITVCTHLRISTLTAL